MKRILKICLLSFLLGVLGMAAEPGSMAKIGETAPPFSLKDQNGKLVSLEAFSDKTVVLEWTNPDCPFVVRHYKQKTMIDTFRTFADRDVVWLAVNSTHYFDQEKNQKWSEKNKLPYPVLDDRDGTVGRLYGAQSTPHMFIVHKGVLVYDGAIDDDPRGQKETRVNFVRSALEEILAGKPVKGAKNRSYGCSVKYAS